MHRFSSSRSVRIGRLLPLYSLLLEFRLGDPASLDDLLHELNLHEGVDARVKDGQPAAAPVVLVATDDRSEVVWAVRSTVTLFDPEAIELRQGEGGR